MATIVKGMFDSKRDAEGVAEHLMRHDGVERGNIRVHVPEPEAVGEKHHSFWESLRDLFLPSEDREAYMEGLRRGSVLVTAEVEDRLVDHVRDVFRGHGAIDIEQRAAGWR